MPQLPLELLEYIVDFLHDDDDALQTCSLTCRYLLPAARLHLFRKVALERVPDCLRFLEVLESSASTQASVANYVRDIRLPFMALVSGTKGQRKGWRHELVRRILRDLCHLTRLRLYAFDWMGFMDMLRVDAAQAGASGSLRDAMRAFFPFPELKELLIDNLVSRSSHQLTLLISLFPRLSRLELQRLVAPVTPGRGLPLPEPPYDPSDLHSAHELGTHLQAIVADFNRSSGSIAARVMDSLLSPPFRLQLCYIEWEMSSRKTSDKFNDVVLLKSALQTSETTLESLKITFSEDSWLRDLDPSRHKQLKHLMFVFCRDSADPFLAELPSFLSSLSSDHLQEVYLHAEADPEMGIDWNMTDWQQMDDALAGLHKRCPSLIITFHFHFYGVLPVRSKRPDVVEPLRERIPLALGSGMRIASVLSAMTFRSLNDDTQPLAMGFIVGPEEWHWLTPTT